MVRRRQTTPASGRTSPESSFFDATTMSNGGSTEDTAPSVKSYVFKLWRSRWSTQWRYFRIVGRLVVACSFAICLGQHYSLRPLAGGVQSSILEDGSIHPPILIRRLEDTNVAASFPTVVATLRPLESRGGPFYDRLRIHKNPMMNGKPYEFARKINPRDEFLDHRSRRVMLYEMDRELNIKYDHEEELDYKDTACRRPSWYGDYFPTCNNFHEIDMARSSDDAIPNLDSKYFGHGYFRDAWMVSNDLDSGAQLVLKTTRFRHKFKIDFIEKVRKDALIMSVMSASPRIVDIYGACSGSLAVQPVRTNMLDVWIPRYRQTKYQASRDVPGLHVNGTVRSENNLTITEKLNDATEIARAVADLHGSKYGKIVHDDLMPDQWLRTADGQLLLSDFNRAFIMEWNVEKEEYCKIDEFRGANYYDAPEVESEAPNDEKINVYQFGGHIYSLITGLRVYQEDYVGDARTKIENGIGPYLDDTFRNGSYVERELIKIMERCWEYDPDKRPDIFEVIRMLREVQAKHRQDMAL